MSSCISREVDVRLFPKVASWRRVQRGLFSYSINDGIYFIMKHKSPVTNSQKLFQFYITSPGEASCRMGKVHHRKLILTLNPVQLSAI